MSKPRSGISSRAIVAVTLIVASFFSSFALSRAANRTELVWGARVVLLPGTSIHQKDLELHRVALPEGSSNYVGQRDQIIGFQVLRAVGAGELIPSSSINRDSHVMLNVDVPLEIQASGLPSGIGVGDKVNIYQVIDQQGQIQNRPPSLILSDIFVSDLDQKSQNMNGSALLTLSVPRTAVIRLLTATNIGRIVLVLLHG